MLSTTTLVLSQSGTLIQTNLVSKQALVGLHLLFSGFVVSKVDEIIPKVFPGYLVHYVIPDSIYLLLGWTLFPNQCYPFAMNMVTHYIKTVF